MHGIDLAAEMAAARQRRMEQTARALRDARVLAVRAAARPGATHEEVEDMARSFYPRLNAEQIDEVTRLVWANQRGGEVRIPTRSDDEVEEVAAVAEVADPALEDDPVAEA